MEDLTTFGGRLKKAIRERESWSLNQLADALKDLPTDRKPRGIHRVTLTSFTSAEGQKKKRVPRDPKLYAAIADILNIRREWLAYGEGEMRHAGPAPAGWNSDTGQVISTALWVIAGGSTESREAFREILDTPDEQGRHFQEYFGATPQLTEVFRTRFGHVFAQDLKRQPKLSFEEKAARARTLGHLVLEPIRELAPNWSGDYRSEAFSDYAMAALSAYALATRLQPYPTLEEDTDE